VGTAVGRGVAVGPPVVAVGEGWDRVAVGLGVVVAGTGVDVPLVVAVVVDVLTMIGVHVGVGCADPEAGTDPAPGMTRTCPGRISAAWVMPLASASAWAVTPKRAAISYSVSPAFTV
jgi:hypothetical protein